MSFPTLWKMEERKRDSGECTWFGKGGEDGLGDPVCPGDSGNRTQVFLRNFLLGNTYQKHQWSFFHDCYDSESP